MWTTERSQPAGRTILTSCTACQVPTGGGTVTCDGLACVPACPAQSKLCAGACIPSANACNGVCPAGMHNCSGICQPDTSTSFCGATCTSCPTPASNGGASCDITSGTCRIACNSGFKNCPGTNLCVPTAGCCVNADCTSGPANSVGVCGTANTCSYPCANGFTACGNACIPKGGCCTDSDCPGSALACSGTCQTNHTCLFPTGSCGLAICSGTQVIDPGTCSAGTCNSPLPTNCPNNLACSAGSCKTSCSSSADCAPNFACLLGTACVAASVDQQQPMRSAVSGPLGGTLTNEKLAQVVTAGRAGMLVEVRLAVTCTRRSCNVCPNSGCHGGRCSRWNHPVERHCPAWPASQRRLP